MRLQLTLPVGSNVFGGPYVQVKLEKTVSERERERERER